MAGESYAIPPKDRAVEGILWYIQHHQLAGGDRLPAERVLCEEIGVSRTALRAGITRLISCGTLESRRGSGTYVCPPKPLNIFQETYNFSDAVRTAGLHPSSRLVSTGTIEADEALADKLGVAVGAPLLRMQRVRLIEGEPASIETAHVNLSLCPSLPEHDFECESLCSKKVACVLSMDVSISPSRVWTSKRPSCSSKKRERRCSMRARSNLIRTCVLWSIANR